VGVRTTDKKAGPPLVNGRRRDAAVERGRDAQPTQALVRAIEQTADSALITGNDGTIIRVNPAFTDLMGDAAAEAFGSTPRIVKLDGHDSRFSHFVTPGRDVTHGKGPEAAMRRLNSLLELQSARIAGLLHDNAGQLLVSAHMAIADIARDMPAPVQARLQQVRMHLDEVAEQLRSISDELHPSILDDLGLVEAVKFISRVFTRRTGVQLAIEAHLDEPCPATVGAVVYRFVQEALTNIGEHAQAASASIAIAREGSRLLCAICDDGAGFDVAATLASNGNHSLGLMLIRDRLEAVGGTLDITSAPQQGTHLRVVIPLEI
jgi:signal transduction histidine kinase